LSSQAAQNAVPCSEDILGRDLLAGELEICWEIPASPVNHRIAGRPPPDKPSAMKMALTPIENKRFTARYDATPIFMLGGAPTAHEVLSECGFSRDLPGGWHQANPKTAHLTRLPRGRFQFQIAIRLQRTSEGILQNNKRRGSKFKFRFVLVFSQMPKYL
jgi:hypothetical protein